jgi:hypothetical protein
MPPRPGDTEPIEFLPPDERAFGPVGPGTFAGLDHDLAPLPDAEGAPRSRWAPVVAGLAVVGLLAGGVIAAAPWAGDADVAPPASSVPTTVDTSPSTAATTETGVQLATATGWVLDPVPDGLRSAGHVTVGPTIGPKGWGQVWATPGATRTSGRWFSLALAPFRSVDGGPNRLAIDLAGRRAVAEIAPDGVVSVAYDAGSVDALRLVTISAFGFSLDDLGRLADSISFTDDRPQMVDDRPVFNQPELLDGMSGVAAGPTDGDLVEQVLTGRGIESASFYRSANGREVALVVAQRDGAPSDDPLVALALDRYGIAPDGWSVPDTFRGSDVVLGRTHIDGQDAVVARWSADDLVVSVVSTLELDDVLAMVPTARRAEAGEWAVLTSSTGGFETTPPAPPEVRVASGALTDGRTWAITSWPSDDVVQVAVGDVAEIVSVDDIPLRVVGADGRWFVVGLTDASPTELRLTTADGTATASPAPIMRTATDGTHWTSYLSVLPLPDADVVGPFSAELVGPTGEVVARLAPWVRGS